MRFGPKVQAIMEIEGISPSEMETMIDSAAITSVKGFNRRYHHWLFEVQSGDVVAMAYADVTVIGHGETKMEEECDLCGGKKCKYCGWHGYVYRLIV